MADLEAARQEVIDAARDLAYDCENGTKKRLRIALAALDALRQAEPFKVGDYVRWKGHAWDQIVAEPDQYGHYRCLISGCASADQFEPWQPRVGERVVCDNPGHDGPREYDVASVSQEGKEGLVCADAGWCLNGCMGGCNFRTLRPATAEPSGQPAPEILTGVEWDNDSGYLHGMEQSFQMKRDLELRTVARDHEARLRKMEWK